MNLQRGVSQLLTGTYRARYATLGAGAHNHARALRSVAHRLIAVACAMLETGTIFDPNHTRNAPC
jgi:hypothetical protein